MAKSSESTGCHDCFAVCLFWRRKKDQSGNGVRDRGQSSVSNTQLLLVMSTLAHNEQLIDLSLFSNGVRLISIYQFTLDIYQDRI